MWTVSVQRTTSWCWFSVCLPPRVKGFDNSRPFGPSSRHFWRMSVYLSPPPETGETFKFLFFSRNIIPIRRKGKERKEEKKKRVVRLWFLCRFSGRVIFLIRTFDELGMMSPCERGLYVSNNRSVIVEWHEMIRLDGGFCVVINEVVSPIFGDENLRLVPNRYEL